MMCAVTVMWSVFSHLRHAVVLLLQDTWMSQVGAEVLLFSLVEVFIKVTIVLAMFLEEDSVLL